MEAQKRLDEERRKKNEEMQEVIQTLRAQLTDERNQSRKKVDEERQKLDQERKKVDQEREKREADREKHEEERNRLAAALLEFTRADRRRNEVPTAREDMRQSIHWHTVPFAPTAPNFNLVWHSAANYNVVRHQYWTNHAHWEDAKIIREWIEFRKRVESYWELIPFAERYFIEKKVGEKLEELIIGGYRLNTAEYIWGAESLRKYYEERDYGLDKVLEFKDGIRTKKQFQETKRFHLLLKDVEENIRRTNVWGLEEPPYSHVEDVLADIKVAKESRTENVEAMWLAIEERQQLVPTAEETGIVAQAAVVAEPSEARRGNVAGLEAAERVAHRKKFAVRTWQRTAFSMKLYQLFFFATVCPYQLGNMFPIHPRTVEEFITWLFTLPLYPKFTVIDYTWSLRRYCKLSDLKWYGIFNRHCNIGLLVKGFCNDITDTQKSQTMAAMNTQERELHLQAMNTTTLAGLKLYCETVILQKSVQRPISMHCVNCEHLRALRTVHHYNLKIVRLKNNDLDPRDCPFDGPHVDKVLEYLVLMGITLADTYEEAEAQWRQDGSLAVNLRGFYGKPLFPSADDPCEWVSSFEHNYHFIRAWKDTGLSRQKQNDPLELRHLGPYANKKSAYSGVILEGARGNNGILSAECKRNAMQRIGWIAEEGGPAHFGKRTTAHYECYAIPLIRKLGGEHVDVKFRHMCENGELSDERNSTVGLSPFLEKCLLLLGEMSS